jgi:hypothetical protein
MRRSHTLTILFSQALALAATTQLVTGCGKECVNHDSSSDTVVPPRPYGFDSGPPSDGGKDAYARGDADAGEDASDAASEDASADAGVDAYTETEVDLGGSYVDANEVTSNNPQAAFDAGTLADWLARPCRESCMLLHPGYEIRACEPAKLNDEIGQYEVHCDLRSTTCKDPLAISMGSGRRPLGFTPHDRSGTPVAAFFALMVELEDASVPAFEALSADLARHGAPASLVRRARKAARDEVRHTKMAIALARRHGGEVRRAEVPALAPRSLEAMALENAVEGCVNETYGAVLATWAATRALDPRTRAAMAIVARDETGHSALAWDIAEWAEARLDDEARARVVAARREAARTLLDEGTRDVPEELSRAGLMPRQEQARTLLANIDRHLWSRGDETSSAT